MKTSKDWVIPGTGLAVKAGGVLWLGLALCAPTLPAQQPGQIAAQPLKDWHSLSADEAMKGLPIKLEGTVLCYDLGWGQLYVHNGVNAIYVNPRSFTNRFEIGQRVKICGSTAWDGSGPILTNAIATVDGQQSLPRAVPMKLADLAGAKGQWIEVSGEVRVAETSRERIALILKDGDRKCLVYVMRTSSANPFKNLADAVVKIRGINATRTRNGTVESAILFCPGLDQVSVVSPSTESRWKLPVTPIDTVLTRQLDTWTNRPVHINGLVNSYQPGKTIDIKDPSGVLSAEVIQVTPVLLYQRVDLWGYLCVQSNRTVLADGFFEVTSGLPNEFRADAEPRPVPVNEPVLTSIRQIRSLSKQRANQNLPARIQGVLTFVDTDWRMAFVQDEHDAVFLDTAQGDLQAGQWVEVTGQTDGTGYAPELIHCTTRVLGTTNWPAATRADLQDAANGHLDSRWVEMQGVVRSAHKENGHIYLALTGLNGKFDATVLDPNSQNAPVELVDSQISIRGACGSTVNSRGQLSGITLHVPSRDAISILDPSPADPFAVAPIPISTVATFNPERLAGRRVKVSGVVTMAAPGQELYLQDASGGIRIMGSQTNEFQVGERLNVLGFPALLDFSPCLEEAAIRRDGAVSLPEAKATTAVRILQDGTYDGLRVELNAQVLQSHPNAAQAKMLLQDGPIIFTAQIIRPLQRKTMLDLSAGSFIRLRGVCIIQGSENNEPGSFRLLVAGPEDVKVIKTAPWWTTTRAVMVLGGTTLTAFLASAWVLLLRRQVRSQTETIRQNQKELVDTSRLAGMAEVATNVLHNVGNVLNSVNVSATIVTDKLRDSTAATGLSRAVKLVEEHKDDLAEFITKHPRGQQLPGFLKQLAERLHAENDMEITELKSLCKNISHIKEVVAMQLSLAKKGGQLEIVTPNEILEDALLINAGDFARFGIEVKRDYSLVAGQITVDKHKLLQILVNLISNAKNACVESEQSRKEITLQVRRKDGRLEMSVQDNGIGIASENLVRIFNHGFTTRKAGHGFGLHSGALAAKQMGGQLSVESDGPGHGARFTLELPTPT